LYFDNGVKLGEVFSDVDGYQKFWPELRGGYWDTWVLREIADYVDSLNKEWDEQVRKDLDSLN